MCRPPVRCTPRPVEMRLFFARRLSLPQRRGEQTAPPASAEIPPASCRRRSARSAAPSGRRGPLPAAPADARAATSRAPRTIAGSGPAAARPVRPEMRARIGAARLRAKPSRRLRRGLASPRPACGERSDRIADAIRVRGYRSRHAPSRGESPSPRPSPREERGEGEHAYSVTGLSEMSQSLPLKIEM